MILSKSWYEYVRLYEYAIKVKIVKGLKSKCKIPHITIFISI